MASDIPDIRFVEDLARRVGKMFLASLSKLTKRQIYFKGQNDYVTEVDQRSERLIIKEIRKNFPHHQFLAEESAGAPVDLGKPLWIIDPLDGTTNFIHRLPIFSVSIALKIKGKIVLGVVYDPNRNELFSAVRGRGAYLNGKRIKVSQTRKLKDTLLATGFPFRCNDILEDYIKIFRTLCMNSRGMRRGGSSAMDLSYVACGRFDGFWEFGLQPWDVAAGILIVEEAGGMVTDFEGKALALKPQNVLAGNKFIYRQLLKQVVGDRN